MGIELQEINGGLVLLRKEVMMHTSSTRTSFLFLSQKLYNAL